jgi:hypothetical protein
MVNMRVRISDDSREPHDEFHEDVDEVVIMQEEGLTERKCGDCGEPIVNEDPVETDDGPLCANREDECVNGDCEDGQVANPDHDPDAECDEKDCEHETCVEAELIDCEECGGSGFGPHRSEVRGLAWLNRVIIDLDDDKDEVTVGISLGEGYGYFAFQIRRVPEGDSEYSGKLLMHLPYPGASHQHLPVRKIHDGTYEVITDGS